MKNIIFDLGSVILKNKPISILDKFDVSSEEYSALKAYFENNDKLNLGIQTLEEKFDGCNFSEEINKKYRDILTKYYELRDINSDLIKLINVLKHNNYNIYIISNNNRESKIYYMNNPLFKEIDGWIVSCDYGIKKPDGRLFEIFFYKYNVKPSECYFIDDNKDNIESALKYGMDGYIFHEEDDIEMLYDDMREKGINI